MILGFVLIYKLIPVTHVEEKSLPVRKIHSLNLLFTKKIILVIMTGMLLAFFIQGMFTSTLSLIMKQHYSEQVQFVGITVGVAALAGMVQSARWLWEPMIALKFGSISDGRFGRIRLLLLFLLISSISLAFIPLKMSIYSWLVIIFVFMMSATVLTTVTDAIATDIGLEYDSNLVMTYYTLFIDIGAALGPFIVYLIIDFQHGVTSSYLFGSVMFLSLTVQWYWMDKINKRITMPVEVSLK